MKVHSFKHEELWPQQAQLRGHLRSHEIPAAKYLRATVDHPVDGGPHDIIIPYGAVVNRMEFYDLGTPEEAVEAILREHHVRLADLEPHHAESKQGVASGLHPGVEVEISKTQHGILTKILKDNLVTD